MSKYLFVILAAIALAFASVMAVDVGIDKPAPDFTLKDTEGKKHSLSDYKGKYVVLEWINFGCPFVKKHYESGNMQMLQKKYTEKDVVWLSICSSAPGKEGHHSAEEIEKQLKEWEAAQTAYLIDEKGKVGRMYGAKTTPHMFIINPEGNLIYAGGIDDIPSTDTDDIAKAKNYVAAALDAAMSDKEIADQSTKPYGCSVKYGEKMEMKEKMNKMEKMEK